jgi:DNA polymerase-1
MEADGVQLEFRGGAQLTGDPVAIKDIIEKKDIHKFSGSVIFNKPEDQIFGELRTAAKEHTFKPLFNGNSGTAREREYYKAFRKRYNVMNTTQKKWTFEVLTNGYLRTKYGMKFYWPDTKMMADGYITNSTNIFNYPIQSFCTAEIIPLSTYFIWEKLKQRGMKSYIFNSVHDSVVMYVHKDEVDEVINIVKEAFCEEVTEYLDGIYGYKMVVPLGVEIKLGTYWGDGSLKTVTYEYLDGEYI